MLFSSFTFLLQFLPATLLAFAAARRHSPRAGILVLVAASLFFYGAWRPLYLVLFGASIAGNYGLGLLMADPRRRRAIGLAGVAANLALLVYFKYAGFLADNIAALTGTVLPFADIVLPIGISFFTFQQIAYLVDVMRGAPVERDAVSYVLFVSFFPHLIAGPLVHHAEMIPQFKRGRTARSAVLAARGGAVTAGWAWLATLAYTQQIYFDFSGYSEMAIGLGLLFGIRLPVNFRSPYQARSIIDFWRRWHITLSRFLRDYLYIPLGGNRLGAPRRYLNLMITMLLGGLWHGAGWTFLIWGGLHGTYLCANHLWQGRRAEPRPVERPSRIVSGLSWVATFGAVVLAWVFFRAASLSGALHMLAAMTGAGGGQARPYQPDGVLQLAGLPILVGGAGLQAIGLALSFAALLATLALPNVPQIFRYREFRRAPEKPLWLCWRPDGRWALIIALAFALALFGMWQRLEFLYFQF